MRFVFLSELFANETKDLIMMSKKVSSEIQTHPKVKVVAIGGGAINAQDHMIDCDMQGVDFIAVDSDKYGLQYSKAPTKILIGANRTIGLGQLPVPVCRKLAEEAQEIIKRNLDGSDIVFVVTCLGGNTGSGAAPVVASCAREIGALAIGVVTNPFTFEGVRRRKRAEVGNNDLKANVDGILAISNDIVVRILEKSIPVTFAFQALDDVIYRCVRNLVGLMTIPGLSNVELKDVKLPLPNGVDIDNKDEQMLGLPEYNPRSNSDKVREKNEDLKPRTDGKEVCTYLRSIRNDLAKANNIPFESEPCDFEGDCAGTCEKCDQEAVFLRDEINKIPEQERKYPEHTLKDWNKALCTEK